MKRLYKTKSRMFYVEPDIMSKLRMQYDRFISERGIHPKEIYVDKAAYKEYVKLFPRMNGLDKYGFYGGVYFRGAKLKIVDDDGTLAYTIFKNS